MITFKEDVDLTGYSVIIPSICVGNVAQLAVDLIIATLEMKRIGSGYHNACMPIMGPPAYHHDNTKTVSLELYQDAEKKLVVFQLRSPLVSVYIDEFHKDLLKFITTNKISKAYILSSSHAYERHDVNSSLFAYMQSGEFINENLDQYSWQKYNKKIIFGGGNAKKLFDECINSNIPAFLLFNYVSEGDNSVEASQLVGEISKVVNLFEKDVNVKLVIPISWQFLFGNSIPDLIF
ncbi:proteasome assembly chaperone 2 [Condylostylus longicornis]|uniref:proteasome assembly chaperone 2 n=1 Tax=Condylostylus longicornis TaxID=2530218 RepID=UPI00244DBAA2|nr:proteasome assembly chaperone 2 [Condylostylus longicornis]